MVQQRGVGVGVGVGSTVGREGRNDSGEGGREGRKGRQKKGILTNIFDSLPIVIQEQQIHVRGASFSMLNSKGAHVAIVQVQDTTSGKYSGEGGREGMREQHTERRVGVGSTVGKEGGKERGSNIQREG